MCVDSRAINKIVVRSKFPIPNSLFRWSSRKLSGSVIFSKLDLRSGYHQIYILPGGRGWMEDVFQDERGVIRMVGHVIWIVQYSALSCVSWISLSALWLGLVWLSTSMIFSSTSSPSVNTWSIYGRFSLFSSKINSCGATQVQLLGIRCLFLEYVLLSQGISVDSSKIEAIRSWPTPTMFTTVRSFHGLASFYSRFIWDFSSIMAPITDCMQGKVFQWTPEARSIFILTKDKLTHALVLVLPDFSLPCELTCDALKWG